MVETKKKKRNTKTTKAKTRTLVAISHTCLLQNKHQLKQQMGGYQHTISNKDQCNWIWLAHFIPVDSTNVLFFFLFVSKTRMNKQQEHLLSLPLRLNLVQPLHSLCLSCELGVFLPGSIHKQRPSSRLFLVMTIVPLGPGISRRDVIFSSPVYFIHCVSWLSSTASCQSFAL